MKKLFSLILALALALSLCACAVSTDTETTGDCAALGSAEMSNTETEIISAISSCLQVVDGKDWYEGAPITQNRNGRLIVVHNVGTVTDAKNGDGEITYGGYIGYHDLAARGTIHNGDIVDTYLFVNPETDFWDDYILRWDVVREDGN